MSKVALIRCESYDYNEVKAAIQKGLGLLGGALAFVKLGENILLKPNWLSATPPEKMVTTHPAVFKAVCEVLKDVGARLTYGDSPNHHTPQNAAQKTGFAKVASDLGITLADFNNGKEIHYAEGIQNKRFTIANGVLQSNGIISLPKLKTHAFLKLTGAVKNQFGCIPGMLKMEYHGKLHEPENFAKMLVDLNMYLNPRLFIMDGIIAMEGNGPMSGIPKKMNVLLFSADPIALDATVCRMINVNPEYSYTITQGEKAGLGTYLENKIELLGDPLDSFKAPDFKANRDPISKIQGGNSLFRFFSGSVVSRPYITESLCVKCGDCIKTCPSNPKAVDWHDGDKSKTPSYKYDRCISCFCCQEVCPQGAIKIKKPFFGRLLFRI